MKHMVAKLSYLDNMHHLKLSRDDQYKLKCFLMFKILITLANMIPL